MSDRQTAETCRWCERERELVTNRGMCSRLVAGDTGEVLEVPYGEVCEECFEEIVTQWSETGELSRPLSAFGGASA